MLLKLWPIIRFRMDKFLHECFIFVVLIGCIRPPCDRGVAVLSHVGTNYFPSFQKGYISLSFHLKYFHFFLVNIARSRVSRMILSTVCTSNFLQAIFFHMVRVLLTAFGTYLSSSTSFPVVSIFMAFEAPQGYWDVLLDSLKTTADLHLLRRIELIKCKDVSVGLDSYFAFTNGDSTYICNSLFFQG